MVKISSIRQRAVYPRWRGEHHGATGNVQRPGGLSPLARGTPRCDGKRSAARRFIPAGAGNTTVRRETFSGPAVYPRWRGEHEKMGAPELARRGLSPLARGTHASAQILFIICRFIPAGAGYTLRACVFADQRSVYPRWRGEHSKHNLLLINDFLSQSQSTNFIVSHKQHIHYVKEHLIH